jgi:SAM-dependent methyltransferase
MVLGVAEFVLGRRLKSVLDVGCGEASWQPVLKRHRPSLTYLGIDSSEYVVRRFGRRRGIACGTFGDIDGAAPARPFDLVIASDVLHYLPGDELRDGLPALASRVGGVAYFDFFTSADAVEGDLREMKLRPPRYYLGLFRRHNLYPLGMQLFGGRSLVRGLTGMERLSLDVHAMGKQKGSPPL